LTPNQYGILTIFACCDVLLLCKTQDVHTRIVNGVPDLIKKLCE